MPFDVVPSEAVSGSQPLVVEASTASDQLLAISRSVGLAIPINMALGVAIAVMAATEGRAAAGLVWLGSSTVVNLFRLAVARAGIAAARSGARAQRVAALLRVSWMSALASGLIWAVLPFLGGGGFEAGAMFYLIVICGTTAGAITHGTAYARVPLCFSLPALASAAVNLGLQPDCQHRMLAATVLLYAAGLRRAAMQSEETFRANTRIKNGATAMAASLSAAHEAADLVAVEMKRRATHDSLTGLLNRDGFLTALRDEIAGGGEVCLTLLDLDGFKAVNDLFGHPMGDRVLVEVAERLRRALPEGCRIARLGGDEFAVLYAVDAAAEPPSMLAGRLLARLSAALPFLETCRIGAGAGIRVAQGEGATQMLASADAALYAAKAAGRNRHYLYDDLLERQRSRRSAIERDLARSLEAGAVGVWFQPIWSPDAASVASYEALLRWQHPTIGPVSPPELLDAAAAGGLVDPLLRAVLGGVCAMMARLVADGRSDVVVAMNVSPRELHHVPVADIVLAELAGRGLPPGMLRIEITEEVALDAAHVDGQLAALAAAGVRLGIDDFGTGYSSLAHLRTLPVDCVKIDRSFVAGIAGSARDRALIEAILAIGRSLDICVVAEGVETAEQLHVLRGMGRVHLQGWLLGKAMPADMAATCEARQTMAMVGAAPPPPSLA